MRTIIIAAFVFAGTLFTTAQAVSLQSHKNFKINSAETEGQPKDHISWEKSEADSRNSIGKMHAETSFKLKKMKRKAKKALRKMGEGLADAADTLGDAFD